MLYRLHSAGDDLGVLEPLPFLDVSDLDVLFEDTPLLPIFQERQRVAGPNASKSSVTWAQGKRLENATR